MAENSGAGPGRTQRTIENSSLEIWGGVEYTCNRVRNRYFDQMNLSGHAGRPEDYELFAALGITTYRLGLLWERHVLDPSWAWSDDRLRRLVDLGIRPVASLVHHGSGPRHTSLLDPAFPQKLAAYAASVAERYPWLDAYTPVNEPHTTARFSGRYGIWYPHHTSNQSFMRALVQQVKGTVLSMEAIRRVQPEAQLIQTDDVGRISGTEALRSTWELLNLRQWLPFDLLCGMVDRHHPMFNVMRSAGLSEAEIFWFCEHPCPPSVVGINYYVTSDRHLDERHELYPANRRSAEGPFVDVEAVRVHTAGLTGVDALLRNAWERYGLPVAITEVHLGCSVEEQIRWLVEMWEGATRARGQGVECIAVTLWALLGSFYWNQLVTRANGHYEPGVFDVRSGVPVRTELADIVAQMARGETPSHPALSRHGWWRDPARSYFPCGEEMAGAAA